MYATFVLRTEGLSQRIFFFFTVPAGGASAVSGTVVRVVFEGLFQLAFQIDLGVAQFAGGTCAEFQPFHVVGEGEFGSRGGAFLADDAYGEDGEVVQFHVFAVQNKFFGTGNHVGEHPFD